jgi:hypothetical protein
MKYMWEGMNKMSKTKIPQEDILVYFLNNIPKPRMISNIPEVPFINIG